MDQTKIWDYFQNSDEVAGVAFNARPRYESMAKRISPNTSVLNIGVGHGGLEAILVKKSVIVSSLDPSEESIKKLRSQYELGNRAQVGFSQLMPFDDNQFDVVVMSEVLEHLTDVVIDATLREVFRVLKPHGRFIGTVPADEKLLDNRVMCPHCGEIFHRWGHAQTFTEQHLQHLLRSCFYDVSISRHFFGEHRTLNWKGLVGWTVKKIFVGLGIKGNGETFLFSAYKP
jgi:ubiquinone/menaquinone biosynthesis C-methylase UbiE